MKHNYMLRLILLFALLVAHNNIWGQTYKKASSISKGDIVVFVIEGVYTTTGFTGTELSGISTTSTKYGIGTEFKTAPAGTMEFEVVDGYSTGSFAFKNGSNYLYWTSGNSLATNSSLSDNTSWTVSISNGNATILNKNDSNRQIWWNVSSPRFACYTGKADGDSYKCPQIYKKAYSVTYAANGGTGTMTDNNSPYFIGATVTLLDNAFTAPADNTFNGWVVTDSSSGSVAVSNNQFTMPAKDVTVTAQWVPSASDYITANPTSITGISSNGDVVEFDLTTNIESPDYHVAYYTTSAGDVAITKPSWFGDVEFSGNSLDIAVNANATASSRTAYLKVYSGTTYSPVLTITQNAFVVIPPSFNPVSGTSLVSEDVVELSCTTPNATIYYTMGNNPANPTNASTEYDPDEGVVVIESTTIKAIAYVGEVASEVSTASYTVVTPKANIAALTAETTANTYCVTLSNAVVTYNNGNYAYIQDASGAVAMYKSGHGLVAGNILNGTATVAYQLRNGNPQITDLSGITPASGDAPSPTAVAQTAWDYTFSNVLGQYFQITGATITSNNSKYYVSLGGESIQLYKVGTALASLDLTKTYTITGFPTLYVKDNTTTKELQIFDAPVALKTDPTISFNNGNVRVGKTLDLSTLFTSNSTGTVTYSITAGDSYATIDGSTLTGTAEGSVTVKAAQAESTSYNAGEATAIITVNPALVLSSIAVTTAPTKTTYNEGENFDPTGMVVTATYSDNSTEEVTTYTYAPDGALSTSDTEITISYTENNVMKTAKQAITVNEVIDYVALPFEWEGGASSSLTTITGVTASGLGSDYASGNSPYLIKMDGVGDYILVKTDSQPEQVFVDVKMIGGKDTSKIKIQESADGSDFSDVEELTISGNQNDIKELETSNSFAATTRYVKIIKSVHGSNIGVGPITITKYSTDPAITLDKTSVEAVAAGADGTIKVTCKNMANTPNLEVLFYESNGTTSATYDWLTASINGDGNVAYTINANTGEERNAYFKVHEKTYNVISGLVSITQNKYVIDYASLPFEWDDTSTPTGVTNDGVGTYSSSPYLKFDGTGDFIILKINETPGILSFDIKGNGFSSGSTSTFSVLYSENGTDYSVLAEYNELGDKSTKVFNNLAANVRYIKWIYTEKGSSNGGNVALGNIKLYNAIPATAATVLSENKYVTSFYSGTKNYQLSEGALAYTVGLVNDKLVFYRIGEASNVIPKGNAVVIISSVESIKYTEIKDNVVPAGATIHEGNKLKGKDTDYTPQGTTVYVLGIDNNNGIGFYKLKAGTTIPAGKAYYEVEQ